MAVIGRPFDISCLRPTPDAVNDRPTKSASLLMINFAAIGASFGTSLGRSMKNLRDIPNSAQRDASGHAQNPCNLIPQAITKPNFFRVSSKGSFAILI
ncbi:hypothetical protein [Acuticoccus sediminis]|uniref:hypothetical protein n=1 Tax=Acuticoccus sediminis TaxID=2184697 RepID=UPI001CFD4AEA|nr:hypothetical protein [Acuticoccus sediminis]